MENNIPIHLQEIIFATSDTALNRQLSKLEKEGQIKKIAPRIYTSNFNESEEVIIRRTKFDLDKDEKRAHILEGLKIALDHIDEIVKLIKSSKSDDEALQGLINNFELFDDYYEYLKGNIYEKSCYYQCEFTSRQVKKYKIDVNKIKNNAFIDYTIADDSLDNELENLHAEFKNAKLKKEKNKL